MSLRVGVLTGTRAEYGLLRPVIRAIDDAPELELRVLVAGSHLLKPTETWRDVERAWPIAARIEMQRDGEVGRLSDARALGRGTEGVANAIERLGIECLAVLGDRIEALAGASAASVGGVLTAHLHGGDVAEGVADEAMRHAISKLAHIHLPATEASARRIASMGESESRIHVVGSPAIDGLRGIQPMGDAQAVEIGDPEALVLFHPIGDDDDIECSRMLRLLEALRDQRVMVMQPNFDPGRAGIIDAIEQTHAATCAHLDRRAFLSLLQRLANRGGVLVGNSSAGLIECAALRLPVVNVGERQGGRERGTNVVTVTGESSAEIRAAAQQAQSMDRSTITHPFGQGNAGARVAEALAEVAALGAGARRSLLRKRHAEQIVDRVAT